MDEPRTNRFLGLLQTLVQHEVTKEQANRDKDRAMLPVLRQTLAIKRTQPED